MTIYPYLGVCSNPYGEGYNFPMATADERCPVEDCECTPRVFVPLAANQRVKREDEAARTCRHDGGKPCPPRTPDCDCEDIAALEAERDALHAAHESLIAELATILGPGKAPSGVGREEWWIGRVGGALAAVEVERDAARADVDALLEAIAAVENAAALHQAWSAALVSLADTANEIAAKREGQG